MITENNPDVVVITGDIYESCVRKSPYKLLHELCCGVKTICTLGNHEFFDFEVSYIHNWLTEMYKPEKFDVHYLDIVGHIDVGNVRFFGNVLWYDGSTKTDQRQEFPGWRICGWQDSRIKKFEPLLECTKCRTQILDNQPEKGQIGVLCTHCIPHVDLNMHIMGWSGGSPYDTYSGVANFLEDVTATYSISGHTHKRTIGKMIAGTACINTGNHYAPPFEHYLLEIEDATI